jgi:hypothetical protein
MANVTVEIPDPFSNLAGAYDRAHWQVEVCSVKSGATLKRGNVVARPSADAGAVSLVTGTTQADAFGVVLDEELMRLRSLLRARSRRREAFEALRSSSALAPTKRRSSRRCAMSASLSKARFQLSHEVERQRCRQRQLHHRWHTAASGLRAA